MLQLHSRHTIHRASFSTPIAWTVCVAVLLAACAPRPAAGPTVVNNPCEDPQYLALKAQPVDSLSEREYEVLRERDQACMEVQKVTSMITAGSERPAPKLDPRLLEARTQAGPFARSSEIVIRNNSQVAVIITSVRLYDCINIRGVCGLSRPNVRIDPGQERRVGLVRFAAGDNPASYHFEYFFEPVANP